ncbi:signal peptide peptidase SppA [Flammeovirga kamogawensis]|uniref:Signal peptide peptidase SppA n=1 Tax=Flammeovirga kamogawensis TaxID=373891 RepID=A0ABX8GWD5_9BACT|nr:signal peptide peptidase SppA [Flammeovirga kamogawensis]MBB6460558.1 protease-4 [Flammeovirga kamogawensis]QWG07918.1 signal peptide peptidase SppA [Flammeovirga kamogawensis]TRX69725.1 signal peptide peptidase SppA [Flammeovirga kamogawensis]
MKGFLKTTFAVVVGICLFTGIFFVGGLVFFVGLAASTSSSQPVTIDQHSVLELKLSQQIAEIGEVDPFESLNSSYFPSKGSASLHEYLDIINKAAADDNISGIYLKGGYFGGSMPMAVEIRAALKAFKSEGKFIYAYADNISEAGYYIISEADKIYLNPIGDLEFNGLSSEILYWKDFFKKIGVEPEVFRVGKYKSAVEPFMTNKMSSANKEQISSYLNSLNDIYLQGVSDSRGIAVEELKEISNKMKIRSSEDALALKFVDELTYEDEVTTQLASELDLEDSNDISFVKYNKYKDVTDPRSRQLGEGKVVVLSAEGEIIYGKAEGGSKAIANVDLVKEINDLADDDDVDAVVLRVNSPGGSALSSDIIWRAVQNLKKKKPVVASMSTYAASGGYYISMGCDKIVAYPNTITGSIGIFGLGFNPSELMQKKLGIKSYAVSTGEFSNFQSMLDDFSDEDFDIIQKSVEKGYKVFTSKAAEGRHMKIDDLLAVAQGRVWTGIQAKKVGLVDELGGYNEAIKIAADLAGLEEGDYKVKYLPGEVDFFQEILKGMDMEVQSRVKQAVLGEYSIKMDKLTNWMQSLQGVQAAIPYYEEIEGFERP